MKQEQAMRRTMVAALAASLLLGGPAGALAARPSMMSAAPAGEQAAYYNACVRVSPALKTQCACRAQAAMKYSPQLRADIILSMTNTAKYAARARSIPHSEIAEWETFSADSAKQCGIDN